MSKKVFIPIKRFTLKITYQQTEVVLLRSKFTKFICSIRDSIKLETTSKLEGKENMHIGKSTKRIVYANFENCIYINEVYGNNYIFVFPFNK